jgi:HPt (histidine-containing phosphotransfer) domain-containing protein
MTEPLDLSRLTQLRELDGMTPRGWEEMVSGLIESLGGVIDRLGAGLAGEDLDEVTQAAHLGRNDALMFGAGELATALGAIERAARVGDADRARRELPRVTSLWSQAHAAIDQLR